MLINFYGSNVREKVDNVIYPVEHVIDTKKELDPSIFAYDYVGYCFLNNRRHSDNIIKSNCLLIDVDNDHSENPSEWFDKDDIEHVLRGVPHVIHYSRHHMLDKKVVKKNGTVTIKARRPKFHVLIAINEITTKEEHDSLIDRLQRYLPFIDEKAKDAAHFFFGTESPKAEVIDGYMTLNELLDELDFDNYDSGEVEIPEGQRNNTMHRFAVKILKKYGDTEKAAALFDERASHCNPLLDDWELESIWKSALSYFKKVIAADPSYKTLDEYLDGNDYKPTDYSDVGQARVLQKYFSNELKYSAATLNIVYRVNKWVESEAGAQAVAQELTERQLRQAEQLIIDNYMKCQELDVFTIVASCKKAEINSHLTKDQQEAYYGYLDALKYKEYVIKRRFSHYITATLKEARPMVEIDSAMLDSNPFLLNTPSGVYDLTVGIDSVREHRPEDLMTKITAKSPSLKGKDLWLKSVNTIFGGNKELIDYVQQMCGMALFGKVYVEACIIAYGEGGNGKSTFFNSISTVIGDYYGSIASDVLTTSIKRDKQADLAELRGRRLVIAAETKVGDRLDESTIKRMCSTDKINACKKYKDPFDFTPSHTLVIYTNNLPKVATVDDGTWRRIIVIPFNHKFTGKEDIKNYSEVLVEEAGEYILYWLIEGAKKAYDNHFHIVNPKEVEDAINGYREKSDSIAIFIEERCDTSDKDALCPSGELYTQYRNYCYQNGESARSTTDFYDAIERLGYKKIKKSHKYFIKGLSLLPIDLSPATVDFN